MPDYQAIVDKLVEENHAHIVDLRSDEALPILIQLKADIPAPMAALGLEMGVIDRNRLPKITAQDAFSDTKSKTLYVTMPVKSELDCIIALHELGHIVHNDRGESSVEREARATQWALDHCGFRPSAHTAKEMERALDSYVGTEGGAAVPKLRDELHALQA